jgi:hypothetical protein
VKPACVCHSSKFSATVAEKPAAQIFSIPHCHDVSANDGISNSFPPVPLQVALADGFRYGVFTVRARSSDGKKFMAEGYCVKCKAKREIADGFEEVMKNGRKAIKGKCPTCGTVMFKILGGKAAPAAAPTTPSATG